MVVSSRHSNDALVCSTTWLTDGVGLLSKTEFFKYYCLFLTRICRGKHFTQY